MMLSRSTIVLQILLCLFRIEPAMATSSPFGEKHKDVALRMIGHQVLLKDGDSTSRVLPVHTEGNRSIIRFDTDFSFNPDDLKDAVDSIFQSAGIITPYILEVQLCENNEVVYSYEVNENSEADIVPCRSRDQPKACYLIALTFPYQESESSLLLYVLIIGLLLISVFIVYRIIRKRSKSREHWIKLGRYHFDQHSSMLILQEERIELTSKEADLLLLLYNSVNQTVERNEILQKVWGDEGDYIGRTLDVFISKLRKKLEADPGIKIVNARGVGYKLVVEV